MRCGSRRRGGSAGSTRRRTVRSFEPVLLAPDASFGNVAFGAGDAWVADSSTGHVFRVDRSGRSSSLALPAGVGELASTDDMMWATNSKTGQLTGIDLVTGETDRTIDTGHATLSVAAGGGEIMVAVVPTMVESIAGLDGSVLNLATSGAPWTDPSPDPAMVWNSPARQALYLTCVGLLNYPDKPAPDGWTLEPEVAAAMPTVSPDGRTYTFTIRPGFMFSPPSNEPVTAETFRATIERALSPVLDDGSPGPAYFSDVVGAKAYRAGTADHVSGLVASGDRFAITLEAPAPDLLNRLALPFVCPVPARTPVLRSGLDPNPPVSGAGPYYLASAGRHSAITPRLIVLKKNPNYHGPRPRPFDNIAIQTQTAPAISIGKVRSGELDATMLNGGEPISSGTGTIAAEWGPGSRNASAGDQRWFGSAGLGMDYLMLNTSRRVFRDPAVRRAVSLALDRAALSGIWVTAPSAGLLPPSVPGSDAAAGGLTPAPDLDAARALLKGRTFKVTMMGWPTAWQCGPCRDFEVAVTGQLKAIGITVVVRHEDDYPGDALDAGSTVDLLNWGTGTDYPDPVAFLGGLRADPWIGKANLAELDRLQTVSGQARIDGAAALARRLVDEAIVLPHGYPVTPFFMSERIGCGFVQPALGSVDLLGLCVKPGAGGATAPSPSANP